jgi:hypothetical protein
MNLFSGKNLNILGGCALIVASAALLGVPTLNLEGPLGDLEINPFNASFLVFGILGMTKGLTSIRKAAEAL